MRSQCSPAHHNVCLPLDGNRSKNNSIENTVWLYNYSWYLWIQLMLIFAKTKSRLLCSNNIFLSLKNWKLYAEGEFLSTGFVNLSSFDRFVKLLCPLWPLGADFRCFGSVRPVCWRTHISQDSKNAYSVVFYLRGVGIRWCLRKPSQLHTSPSGVLCLLKVVCDIGE